MPAIRRRARRRSITTKCGRSLEGSVEIPVPLPAERARFDLGNAHATQFIDFNVFVGGRSELEYLRHIGALDEDFKPVAGQPLDLARYLQQAAPPPADAAAAVRVRGPQASPGNDGQAWVPGGTALPYSVSFANPGAHPAGQLRIVSPLDRDLDPRSFRLGDLRIGDIDVHLPADRASFQGDFDFSASRGFILRVSAGVDASSGIATWLLQAIDPDSGEVLRDMPPAACSDRRPRACRTRFPKPARRTPSSCCAASSATPSAPPTLPLRAPRSPVMRA
jgi:hypothetical protein